MQSLTRSTILTLDLKSTSTALVSTLSTLDESAQKVAPLVGMLRFQFLAKEGNLADIEKRFPPESLAPSTLRNCKVYEHVFRDHVQAGKLNEEQFMALSFADCRALMEARKLAKDASRAGKLKMQEAEAEALKNGLPAKDVLAAVKKADKAMVTAANKAAKEKEAAQEAAKAAREAEAAKFKAWKESGAPSASAPITPAPPPLPDSAHELAPLLWDMVNKLKPRQRAAMADILRGMADRIESDSQEAGPAANVIPMEKAA